MKFIQTLYIDNAKDAFKDTFGWASIEYHLMSWALSCLLLKDLYGEVELYANSRAADLLIKRLGLPYSKVHISHDSLKLPHNELWALSKIYTYSLQKEPFLHIDGDVFLFNKFDESLLCSPLIGQNVEVATEYYGATQQEIQRQFSYIPLCVKNDFEFSKPIYAVNAGILGGQDIDFFKEYTKLAFEYIEKNKQNFKHINTSMFNVFFEQHLFYALANEKRIPVKVYFKEIFKDNGYTNMGDIHRVPYEINYLHMLGDYKQDEFTCIQMSAKLRELYPDYYYRILDLLHKKNVATSKNFCGYCTENKNRELKENENTNLLLLKRILKTHEEQKDFDDFYKQLLDFLKEEIPFSDLDKRDVESLKWYRTIFDNNDFYDSVIVKCPMTKVLNSEYNWSGKFNKVYRASTEYYKNLEFKKGTFYHLVIPECSNNGFSLYDIDELDNMVLEKLEKPVQMRVFLRTISQCFENEIIENHYEDFLKLIKNCLKRLVLNKAIMPV